MAFTVLSSAQSHTHERRQRGKHRACARIADQRDQPERSSPLFHLKAQAPGGTIKITAEKPGIDANMLRMYAVAKNDRLKTTELRQRYSPAANRMQHGALNSTLLRSDCKIFVRCG